MIDLDPTPKLYADIHPERLSIEDLKESLAIFAGEPAPARLEGPPGRSPVHERIAAESQAALSKGRYEEAVFQAGRCLTRYLKRPAEEQRGLRALYDALVLASRDHETRLLLAANEFGAQQYIVFVSRLARAVEKMSRSEA